MEILRPSCLEPQDEELFVRKGFVVSTSLPAILQEKLKTVTSSDANLDASLEETKNEILEALSRFISVNNAYRETLSPGTPSTEREESSVSLEKVIDALKRLKFLCDEFFMICSERLHREPWHSVPLLWRFLYAFTAFLECFAFLIGLSIPPESIFYDADCPPLLPHAKPAENAGYVNSAYYFADMALIMGGAETPLAPLLFKLLEILQHVEASPPPPMETTESTCATLPSKRLKRDPILTSSLCYKPSLSEETSLPTSIPREISHTSLSIVSFEQKYYSTRQPVLIYDLVKSSPAYHKWKDFNYFRRIAGKRTIPVEIGKMYTESGWTQKLMTFKKFLDCYIENEPAEGNAYLAQHPIFQQIPQLSDDIIPPDYIYCGSDDMEKPLQLLWLGPRGTISPLHTDRYDNIFAQVVGTKYLRLYPPTASESMYPYTKGPLTNTSQIKCDLQIMDAKTKFYLTSKFPTFLSEGYFEVIITAGDALYIPKGWWHFVKSLSASASVSFWF